MTAPGDEQANTGVEGAALPLRRIGTMWVNPHSNAAGGPRRDYLSSFFAALVAGTSAAAGAASSATSSRPCLAITTATWPLE